MCPKHWFQKQAVDMALQVLRCFQFLFLTLKRVHACKFVLMAAWRMQLVKDLWRCLNRKHFSVALRFKASPRCPKATHYPSSLHAHASSLALLSSGVVFSQSSKRATNRSPALWHQGLFSHNGQKWLQKQRTEGMVHCNWEKKIPKALHLKTANAG